MPPPKPPVSAAPKKYCTVKIKAVFKTGGKPVAKAICHSEAVGANLAVRELGKTRGDGVLPNLKFEPGKHKIYLRFKNHQAEGKPQGNDISQSVIFEGDLVEGTLDIDVQMVQVASSVTVLVVEAGTTTPVAGAKVSTGSFSELTDQNGKVVTDGLATNALHTITVTRGAYADKAGTTEGPVTATVDLTGQTSVSDQNLKVEMKPLWGKVKSGDITVDGKPFPKWYTDNFHPPAQPKEHPTLTVNGQKVPPFPLMSSPGRFTTFFNDLKSWNATDLTVEEFVAIFMIVSNETGGTYAPISERGTSQYMFYLNKPPNRLAGDQLKAKGKLSDDKDVQAWNKKSTGNFPVSFTQPDPAKPGKTKTLTIEEWDAKAKETYPLLTHADLVECDFFKYRGRGFIQETLYTVYMAVVDPVLKAAKLKGCEAMTNAEIDDAMLNKSDVYYPVLRTHMGKIRRQWALTNAQQWRQFGLAIAGTGNTDYGNLFQFRCDAVYAKLKVAADAGKLTLK